MIRGFHLADWFTLANAFCGTGAIFAAMRFLQDGVVRDLLIGMALIPAGLHLRCARRATSRAGGSRRRRWDGELDSLSDISVPAVRPDVDGRPQPFAGWDRKRLGVYTFAS